MSRYYRSWSANRPKKPDSDPLFEQVRREIMKDNRSTWAKANVSGLSTSTLKNWEKGKVKRPQAVSLQMAAKMLRKRILLVDE